MSGTVDDRYFEWLYSQIGSVRSRNPARSYWKLAKKLYITEFVWLVANDDNRVEDGKELRLEFVNEQGSDGINPTWMDLGCSMLEMLIALSRRVAFLADKEPGDWFWIFIQNLDLDSYNDTRFTPHREQIVEEVLERFIYRNYFPDGIGGLFPMDNPTEDQRKVELWHQLSAYLLEKNPL